MMSENDKKVLAEAEQRRPFIHLFKESFGYFLYDVNMDEILSIPREVYESLKGKQEGGSEDAKAYIRNLKADGYLKTARVKKSIHPATKYVKFYLQTKLKHLTLQITQNCNLRCEYCIYSGGYKNRTHSNKVMSFEVAGKAIDYLIAHSGETESVSIGFYGGEPLLEFGLIKKCVEYAEKAGEGRRIVFAITTNATLLREPNISFLADHDFKVLVSLDGPEAIHNKHRKYAGGSEGSFYALLKNVASIKDKYPDFFKKNVSFNTVLDPENDFDSINDFVNNHEVFKNSQFNFSVIDERYKDERNPVSNDFYAQKNYELFKTFLGKIGWLSEPYDSKTMNSYFENINIKKGKAACSREQLPETGHHGGPCIPGVLRLFVNADGNFYPCERVSESSKITCIGNVYTGISEEKAVSLMNVERVTTDQCRECWAYDYCTVCVGSADNMEEMSAEAVKRNCPLIRYQVEEKFKDYCMLRYLGFEF